jgi:hypothetical protein
MKYKNLNGTTQNKCGCGSWIDHWKKFSRQTADECCVIGCTKAATVGGHVQRDSKHDKDWYIVPLCEVHNSKRGEDLNIMDSTVPVSANVNKTCGNVQRTG